MTLKHYKEYDKESIRRVLESGLKRDLHMHTYFSDGELSPKDLIDMRVKQGYQLLAITDHDGDEGSKEGMKYAEKIGLPFISGIELDSVDELGKDIHILGYGFDYDYYGFIQVLWEIRHERARRNDRLMAALNELGYTIDLDDIGGINEGRYVGKPTFARVLQNKGFVNSYLEAFNTIFKEPGIKEIKKETLTSLTAIVTIQEAGGVAVYAHPMEQRMPGESFEEFRPRLYKLLDTMRGYGIDGIECKHPSADEYQSELLLEYADKYGLIVTEGSDIHSPTQQRDYSRYHMP